MVAIRDHHENFLIEFTREFMAMEAIDVDLADLSMDELEKITMNENIHTARYLNIFMHGKSLSKILETIAKGKQRKIIIPGFQLPCKYLLQFLENPYLLSLNVYINFDEWFDWEQRLKNNYTLIEFRGLDITGSLEFHKMLERNNKIRNIRIQKEIQRIQNLCFILLCERKFHSKKLNMDLPYNIPKEILTLILKNFYRSELDSLDNLYIKECDIEDYIEQERLRKVMLIDNALRNKKCLRI